MMKFCKLLACCFFLVQGITLADDNPPTSLDVDSIILSERVTLTPILEAAPPEPPAKIYPTEQTCPGLLMNAAASQAKPWAYGIDTKTGQTYLCNRETGVTKLLPAETTDWSSIVLSPEEQWLILSGLEAEFANRGGPQYFYSYEVASGTLNFLGKVSSLSTFTGFLDWLGETEVTYYTEDALHGGSYYLINLARPNGLEAIISSDASYRENPPRYEYLSSHALLSGDWDNASHQPCVLEFYDLNTRLYFKDEMAYNCGGVYGPNANQYFYVAFDGDVISQSTLNMLNIQSGQRQELYRGEIEALESVSPDGRYAVLIVDDNGVVDRAAMGDQIQFFDWHTLANPEYHFLDTQTGKIIYDLPVLSEPFNPFNPFYYFVNNITYSRGKPLMDVMWLDNQRSLINRAEPDSPPFYHFLSIEANRVAEKPLGVVELILPGAENIVLSETDSEASTIRYSLYNINQGESEALIINPDTELYEFYIRLDDYNQLYLRIRFLDGQSPEYIQYNMTIAGV